MIWKWYSDLEIISAFAHFRINCTSYYIRIWKIYSPNPQLHGHLNNTRQTRILRNEKKFPAIDVLSQPTVSADVGRAKIWRVPQPDQEGRAEEIHCQPYKWISESRNKNCSDIIILANQFDLLHQKKHCFTFTGPFAKTFKSLVNFFSSKRDLVKPTSPDLPHKQ